MSRTVTITEVRRSIRDLTDALRGGEAVVVENYRKPVAVMVQPGAVRALRELHAVNEQGRCGACFQPVPCATVALFGDVDLP